MTNLLTFLYAHIGTILVILSVAHVAVSSILGAINKPTAETSFESVWHYVQILCGFGTTLAVSKSPVAAAQVAALTGDAKALAGK